jgi:heme exporter protein A
MVTLRQLGFGFGQRLLFRNVSASVHAGELLAVSGPNGSGKTTLLSILAGLRLPTQGQIELGGIKRSEIDLLAADDDGHFLNLNAIENLRFWLQLANKPLDSAQLAEDLVRWQIPNHAILSSLSVARFSTGMRRKLALLRMELCRSHLWLLDEPMLGLDRDAITRFRTSLDQHLKRGGACIIVSHDIEKLGDFSYKNLHLVEYMDAQK